MPDYEIRATTRQHTAAIRMTRPMIHIAAAMGEAFPTIYRAIASAGMEPAGMPLAQYLEMHEGVATFECAVPVPTPFEPSEEVAAGTIGGGEAAFTVHVGPYEALADTWEALSQYVAQQGREATAMGWEVYLDDPADVPPDQLRTELYIPLA